MCSKQEEWKESDWSWEKRVEVKIRGIESRRGRGECLIERQRGNKERIQEGKRARHELKIMWFSNLRAFMAYPTTKIWYTVNTCYVDGQHYNYIFVFCIFVYLLIKYIIVGKCFPVFQLYQIYRFRWVLLGN